MGVSCSCPLAFFFDLENGFESLFATSIKLENEEKNALVPSSSFKAKATEPARLQSLGSGKLLLREGSLRFRARKPQIMRFIEAQPDDAYTGQESVHSSILDSSSPKHEAAIKLQKVYKSFRTRRKLADCAVLIEQSWWKVLDFAELKRSSVSFFDIEKHETAISRWSRARTRAAKVKLDIIALLASMDLFSTKGFGSDMWFPCLFQVGKGLSQNSKAQKLALQHWLEAVSMLVTIVRYISASNSEQKLTSNYCLPDRSTTPLWP